MKPKNITLLATVKNREGVAVPYEIAVNAWSTMCDKLVHVGIALVNQHGLEGDHELCSLRWVCEECGAA